MDEKLREEIAIFRYGVISELVSSPLAPGEKEELLVKIAGKEWTIPGTSRRQVGRSTARDWMAQFQTWGWEGLKPAERRDAGSSRTLPEPVQDLLVELCGENPKATVESLIRAVRLSGKVDPQTRMPRSTVHRFLAPHRLPKSFDSCNPDALAFTHPHPGDLWMSDLMYGPRLLVPGRREGKRSYLYAFLDDATRIVPYAAFYAVENASCFQEAFKQALMRRGIPRRLYCDNGATFRTHHLAVICATLNIALIHSRPYQPQGRGKIERFFRHVRTSFLPHLKDEMTASLAALNRVFWAWLEGEYHQPPHRGLEGATPLDRLMQDQALIRPAPENLEDLMRMKVRRRVGRDRTVRLQSRLYETPDGYAGEIIEVLFDPYDPLRPVHFRRPGEEHEVRLRRLDAEGNATRRRPLREAPDKKPGAPTGISYLELLAKSFYRDKNNKSEDK
jgi:transposase InsO family protein